MCIPELTGEVVLEGAFDAEVHARVLELYEADQADREVWEANEAKGEGYENDSSAWSEIERRDRERATEVLGYLEQGLISEAEAFYGAAMVFQHGSCVAHIELANRLAERAVQLGSQEAKWLYAASLDRYLTRTGEKQLYGTQFISEDGGCTYELMPFDKSVTDEERAHYDVPPIAEAIARAEALGGNCDSE